MSTRDLSEQTPSLFDAPPPAARVQESAKEDQGADRLAKDFVRWCCSFGAEFRNSPDISNLRFWVRKFKFKVKDGEETEILQAARPLFLRRIEQLTRKSEAHNQS